MEMTKDVIIARQLRLATISNLVGQGILDEPSAKELLSGALEPGNDSTIVDDSALLGDPEALVKIAAEHSVQPTVLTHCPEGHGLLLFGFCDICKTQYSHSG